MHTMPYLNTSSSDCADQQAQTVAEAYLATLKRHGIDYLYVGAGTDTAPIIEAYAREEESGLSFPVPVLAVHENLALSMAHGYYMASGRPQAVMLHVSVGTANAVCALMNAARAQIPVLFTAGRTPLFEQGVFASRSHDIHWGQEMFDQGGMVRELVKWDYELRDGINVEDIVGRAYSISMSDPKGPVYLTLPREVLARPASANGEPGIVPAATAAYPDPEAISKLAHKLMNAEMPVIVCSSGGVDEQTLGLLVELADKFAIGVAEMHPKYVNFPDTHPMHLGFHAEPVLADADALLFMECDVPWIPAASSPRPDAFVAHASSDPLYTNYPVRSFRSDLTLTAGAKPLLQSLIATMTNIAGPDSSARRKALTAKAQRERSLVEASQRADEDRADAAINKTFFTTCLQAVLPEEAIVVNEYPAMREHLSFSQAGRYFSLPSAGGLGWGLPAALGVQQAKPDALVVCLLGDGAYIFANPAACHQAAAMHELPVLTVLYNNRSWAAVENSTLRLYRGSHSAAYKKAHGAVPLSSLRALPDFEKYAEASGAYSEVVNLRSELAPALERALRVVREERRQALVNVMGV